MDWAMRSRMALRCGSSRRGWLNSFAGLIVPRMVSAFGIFLLRQHYLTIPKELEQAALVDQEGRRGERGHQVARQYQLKWLLRHSRHSRSS